MPRRPTSPAMLTAARRLRQTQTPAEASLWTCLRNRRLDGARFKRQAIIGTYIADFYCPDCRLIVELDGGVHLRPDVQQADGIRQANLEAEGYTVLRFTNTQIENQLDAVMDAIRKHLTPRPR